MLKMIIATSSKEDGYAIGKDNKLLWDVPTDLRYFQKVTTGQCVVMGRKTFDSLPFNGKGLPNRKNVIFSRKPEKTVGSGLLDPFCVTYYNHIRHLKPMASKLSCDTFVIGGASVYEQMLPHVSEIHHSTLSGSYPDADKHFNMDFLDNGEWILYSTDKLCDKATVRVYKRVN